MKKIYSMICFVLVAGRLISQDLTVSLWLNRNEVVSDMTEMLKAEIKNTGNKAAMGYEVAFYASLNTTLGPNDVLLYKKYISSTAAGGVTTIEGSVTLPRGLVPGIYHLIAKADINNKVVEVNENNNTTYKMVRILVPRYDLSITELLPDRYKLTSGSDLIIRTTEYQRGNSYADKHSIRYFLSSDNLYDNNDLFLKSTQVPYFRGFQFKDTVQLTIPATTSVGEYYVIAIADGDGQIKETDESNNIKATYMIQVGNPFTDLEATDIALHTGSMPVTPGALIRTYITCFNKGNTEVKNPFFKFYLSKDNVISSQDILIHEKTVPKITPGGLFSGWINLKIPANTASGSYYVLYEVAGGTPADNNLPNNVTNSVLKVVQGSYEISLSDMFLKGKVTNSGYVFPEATLKNTGSLPVTFTVGYYLSKDTILDQADKYLSLKGYSTTPGSEIRLSDAVSIDAQYQFGDYYIIVKADYNEDISETNESNNLVYSKITFREKNTDLSVSFQNKNPLVLKHSTSFTPAVTLANLGTTFSGFDEIFYYFSKDAKVDNGDIKLLEKRVQGLEGGASRNFYEQLYVSSSLLPGQYYLIVAADVNFIYGAEQNMANNIDYINVTIEGYDADYTISSALQTTGNILAGSTIKVSSTEFNSGSEDGIGHDIGYYLSKDTLYDFSDKILAGTHVFVSAGGSSTVNTSFKIPAITTPGKYYILTKADLTNSVKESNESNNISYLSFEVLANGSNTRKETQSFNRRDINNILVYPNPTNGVLNFTDLAGTDELEITDLTGAMKMNVKTNTISELQVDLAALGTGVYTLKMKNAGSLISVHKVVLNK